jgi:prepilin-type N-terminal cleavage/methylation domain-containing protein
MMTFKHRGDGREGGLRLAACFRGGLWQAADRDGRLLPKDPGARAAGFSLIEVTVAILILGIALVGLVQGITTALSSSKESELQTTAALFAAGQIETLRAEGDFSDGETEGDCGEALPLYRWKQTITSTGIEGLHDVRVQVDNAQSGQAIYELRTLLFEMEGEPGENGTGSTGAGGRERAR